MQKQMKSITKRHANRLRIERAIRDATEEIDITNPPKKYQNGERRITDFELTMCLVVVDK